MLNFADRYVPAAVKSQIQASLHLSDFETTLPNTGMIIVFMIFALIFGYLSDRNIADRRLILACAIVFWSLATGIAGFSKNLVQLIVFRSLVGVGEAAYGTIAPPMIFDFYPIPDRNVAYGIYYLAIPVGAALGFGVGGLLASLFGWRWAFIGCGIPGIIVAITVMRINNPVKGVNDIDSSKPNTLSNTHTNIITNSSSSSIKSNQNQNQNQVQLTTFARTHEEIHDPSPTTTSHHPNSSTHTSKINASSVWLEMKIALSEVKIILSNKVFTLCALGFAASNFALGGLADWASVYLQRYDNATIAEAGFVVGAMTVVGMFNYSI